MEKTEFIRPLSVICNSTFYRVANLPDTYKMNPLDYLAIPDIQTGNNSFCQHYCSPAFSIASRKSRLPVYTAFPQIQP